jgi:hypothetical protein
VLLNMFFINRIDPINCVAKLTDVKPMKTYKAFDVHYKKNPPSTQFYCITSVLATSLVNPFILTCHVRDDIRNEKNVKKIRQK